MEVNVYNDVFTHEEIDSLYLEAQKGLATGVHEDYDNGLVSVLEIDKTDIVNKVKNYLKNKHNITTHCHQIQYQIWRVGSESKLHVHDEWGRGVCDYNTMIYLNDDFDGGEFYTLNTIYKPTKGDVTYFDGEHTWHGVKPVKNKDRYTIIIWWYNTNVPDSY